jgi:hypothetical protein
MVASSGGTSTFSVMLMLWGVMFNDILRIISGAGPDGVMCSGLVLYMLIRRGCHM